MKLIFFILAMPVLSIASEIKVGSKAFTEGFLLGELAAQKLESLPDSQISRKFGLGSTGIVVQALMTDEIDVYPEYTGTIAEAILQDLSIRDSQKIQELLAKKGLIMSRELGFENTYALAVKRDFAKAHNLTKISDLRGLENKVRAAFSPEFLNRDDGVKSIERVYGIKFSNNLQAIDHMLSYQSILENKADLIAVYSTDDKIESLDLVLLNDDRKIFPPYHAVFLAKTSFVESHPAAWAALNELGGTITEKTMQILNGQVERDHASASSVIKSYLNGSKLEAESSSILTEVKRRTLEHLLLVSVALLISIFVGIPLGIIGFRFQYFRKLILGSSSIVQTIPSLALLSLLIPFFGIGLIPALVALCLYSLLPVIQNTLIGFESINSKLIETANAVGLSPRQILFSIELPLASRSILGGVQTAAIIGIGTATLAALIGAGGYGAPIISGLATNNPQMILVGAVPCALMALATFGIFELVSLLIIPKGLRV